jgi:hypothetical protein
VSFVCSPIVPLADFGARFMFEEMLFNRYSHAKGQRMSGHSFMHIVSNTILVRLPPATQRCCWRQHAYILRRLRRVAEASRRQPRETEKGKRSLSATCPRPGYVATSLLLCASTDTPVHLQIARSPLSRPSMKGSHASSPRRKIGTPPRSTMRSKWAGLATAWRCGMQ